jgi:zinc transport system substrate-binding protein
MSPRTFVCLAFTLSAVAAGWSDDGGARAAVGAGVEPIVVSVSVPPMADFARRIGGDRVRTQVMIPPGAVPATFAPRPRQRAHLADSDLYVLVGHEHFVFEKTHVLPYLAQHPEIRVVDMQVEAESGAHVEDPHIWLSPRQVERTARAIARELTLLDPDHHAVYESGLARFRAEIGQLDREIRGRFERGAAGDAKKRFMVLHPAWGWFAADYDLEQIAIEREGKPPGPRRLIPLVEQAQREGVRRIFVQSGFPRRSADVIAEAVGAEVVELDPLAPDWAKNLLTAAILIDGAASATPPRAGP